MLIQELPKPAIHYKVLGAGRNDPKAAFEYIGDAYGPGDAVCVEDAGCPEAGRRGGEMHRQ